MNNKNKIIIKIENGEKQAEAFKRIGDFVNQIAIDYGLNYFEMFGILQSLILELDQNSRTEND